jgi:hypothetical protein
MRISYILLVLCTNISLLGSGGPLNQTATYSCNYAQGVSCNPEVNAQGVSFIWDTSQLIPTDLGTITIEKEITFDFPLLDKKRLYRFLPTQGGQADIGKKLPMLILILPFALHQSLPVGTPEIIQREADAGKREFPAATVMYKIYRKYEGDPADWVEIATVFSDKPLNSQLAKLKPNGDIVVTKRLAVDKSVLRDEIVGETITISLGKF